MLGEAWFRDGGWRFGRVDFGGGSALGPLQFISCVGVCRAAGPSLLPHDRATACLRVMSVVLRMRFCLWK